MANRAGLEQRLDGMQSTLRTLLMVVQSMAGSQGGDFADPSPARSQWQLLPSPNGVDLQQAYQTVMVLWHANFDLGRGLADLIETRRTYSAMTVARTLAESAARSWDLIEEGVEPPRRIERMFNERLFAGYENERLLEGMLVDLANTAGDVLEAAEPLIRERIASERKQREDLLARAVRYGLTASKSRNGAPAVGAGRPTSMALLARMLGDQVPAASFFRMNSAVAHTALHGQARMISMSQRPDKALTSLPVAMHPD